MDIPRRNLIDIISLVNSSLFDSKFFALNYFTSMNAGLLYRKLKLGPSFFKNGT